MDATHTDPAGAGALALSFLGCGNSSSRDLGNSAAVLESDGQPLLLIDCGPEVPAAFAARHGNALPPALFLTHCHLDHIGGLEQLFYRGMFRTDDQPLPRLFVPVALVAILQRRLADYPGNLAEGGANFWDAFQLVPVSERFWHADLCFSVFPVRHHAPQSAFGLALEGRFLYTGDTRPIPELIAHQASRGELIFHDCALVGNPAHTGLDDLTREYNPEQLRRIVLYHCESQAAASCMRARGHRVARAGERFDLGGGRFSATRPSKALEIPAQAGALRVSG
ncbi:MAG: MBL fold metallo-hydrolase [Chromatiales bacterium]|nr:MBL fold metallo-hydrolase [Chromatiales bacterium]